ncbi:MAG: hypothetical protein FD126_1669, partial [Elusimicrobia bacterium]
MAEADTVCPYCSRDFSAPAARKAPEPEPEEAPRAKEPALRVPTPELEAEPEAKPPAREKPRLEEREPDRDPEPPPSAGYEIDNPPAYVPGTFSNSTPITP